ncbi:MAG: co-chaperone GroES [Patescibacteria group bacterium]
MTPARATSSVGITPLNDRVVLRPLSAEEMGTTTVSGIIIPDSSKEKPEQGMVVAVGPGKWNEDGGRTPVSVSVGDRVMFSKYGFDEIKLKGVTYYVIAESNVLAVLN